MGLLLVVVWGATAFVLGHPLATLINKSNQGSVPLDFGESLFSSLFLGSTIIGWLSLSLLQLGTYSFLYLGAALTTVLLLKILGLRFTNKIVSFTHSDIE